MTDLTAAWGYECQDLDWADVAAIGVVARLHYPEDYPRLVHRSLARSRWDEHRRIVADALRKAYCEGRAGPRFTSPEVMRCRACNYWDEFVDNAKSGLCGWDAEPTPAGGHCHRWAAR